MRRILTVLLISGALCAPLAVADQLTETVQKDLVKLGYDPGNISGEMTTDTAVAISRFQAENGLEVTGEPSPQLAGILQARVAQQSSGNSAAATPAATPPQRTPAELQAAQQACLQEKIEAQQEANKKKRAFGRLVSAVGRTAGMTGSELAGDVYRASSVVYGANATAEDLSAAARDLGLTEDEVEDCRNPPA